MTSNRFVVLDGLRGVAALVVLVFHLAEQRSLASAPPFAALAVDFFYVLSGFVVAFAYEQKLRTGSISLGDFAAVRVRRLYPLLFLGTFAGIALGVLAVVAKHDVSLMQIAMAGGLALLVLPSFVFSQWATAYPFNMAAWSLTFEVFINAVYAVLVRWLSNRLLIVIIASSGVLLACLFLNEGGIAGGNNQSNFWLGFPRVIYPFFCGVLLYRFRPQQRMRSRAALFLLFILPAFLMAYWPWYTYISIAYVVALFPLIVFLGSACGVQGSLLAGCNIAGELSYPVYILQGPVLRIGEEILKYRHLGTFPFLAFACFEALTVIVISWFALKRFDEPLRLLMRTRKRRKVALQQD